MPLTKCVRFSAGCFILLVFILILNFSYNTKGWTAYVFFSRQSSRRVVIIPIFLRIFSEVEELVKSSFIFFLQIGWGPNESSNVVKIQYHHILEVESLATYMYKHVVLYFLTNLRNIYNTESLFSSCKYSQCPKNIKKKKKKNQCSQDLPVTFKSIISIFFYFIHGQVSCQPVADRHAHFCQSCLQHEVWN